MLQISFLFIGFIVLILAISSMFKNYSRYILWTVAILLFVATLLLVGFGVINPIKDGVVDMNILFAIIISISCSGGLVWGAEKWHSKIREKENMDNEPKMNNEAFIQTDNKIKLPTRLDTEVARKVFSRAIDAGYIIVEGDHYVWTETKVLLAYMCGRIYCEDYPEKTRYDEKMFWGPGKIDLFPDADLNTLFNQTDLTQSRHNRKGKPAPTGHEKIDKLFE